MNALRAQISKVLAWSAVDGPGNRMVLFLQGCNFHCLACHNPHTMGRCDACGACLSSCPTSAISRVDGRIVFDAGLCTACDACLEACPIHANPMVKSYGVDEVMALVRANSAFVSGLTVSGGEATQQLPFVRALFAAMGAANDLRHLTRFIDSNGHLGPAGWRSVLEVTNGVMLDIKAFDPERHHRLTGRDNARVLDSARLLHAAGKLHELRFLMIPGETDNEAELESLIAFVGALGGDVRIRLNAFQTHGVRGVAANWPKMSRDGIEAAAGRLAAAGLGPVAVPVVYV